MIVCIECRQPRMRYEGDLCRECFEKIENRKIREPLNILPSRDGRPEWIKPVLKDDGDN